MPAWAFWLTLGADIFALLFAVYLLAVWWSKPRW